MSLHELNSAGIWIKQIWIRLVSPNLSWPAFEIKTNKGVSAPTKKLFISTNFLSSPTTAEGLSLLDKFRPKRTNLQMHITQNLSRAKAGQTRRHKQNRN